MPGFSASAAVRASDDKFSLCLNVKHRLAVGSVSDIAHPRGCLPQDVDVLLATNLVLTLSGKTDNLKISSERIVKSAVAHHLRAYLELNASRLGLNAISNVYLDNDGLSKMILCGSRPSPKGRQNSHSVKLVAVDMNFIWKTIPSEHIELDLHSDTSAPQDTNPFTAKLLLPYRSILNQVIERFVTYQLVRRYPLIFGALGQVRLPILLSGLILILLPTTQKLDSETPFFTPLARSLLDTIMHSASPSFQRKCRKALRTIEQENMSAFEASSASLSSYLSDTAHEQFTDASEEFSVEGIVTDEETLCMSMERLFKRGLRRPLFKGVNLDPNRYAEDTDDESDLVALQAFDTYSCPQLHDPRDIPLPSENFEHIPLSYIFNSDDQELWPGDDIWTENDDGAVQLQGDDLTWASPVSSQDSSFYQDSSVVDPASETCYSSSSTSQCSSSPQSQSQPEIFHTLQYNNFGPGLEGNYSTDTNCDPIQRTHVYRSQDSPDAPILSASSLTNQFSNAAAFDRQNVNWSRTSASPDLPLALPELYQPPLLVHSNKGIYPDDVGLESDDDCGMSINMNQDPVVAIEALVQEENRNYPFSYQDAFAITSADGILSEHDILDCDSLSDTDMGGDIPDTIAIPPLAKRPPFILSHNECQNEVYNANGDFILNISADPESQLHLQEFILCTLEHGDLEDNMDVGMLDFEGTGP